MLKDEILSAPLRETHLFFVNQAGFVIKSPAGTLVAVDLYLSDAAERHDGYKRLAPKLLHPSDIVFDAVICTHAHYDHFDPDSVPVLLSNPKTRLFASAHCEPECESLGLNAEQISYVKAGDFAKVGDVDAEFVFCDHGASAPDAVGVVLTVGGKTIYEAGDTCLRLDKVDEIAKGRTFDVAIFPINGAFGNMNEGEAAKLCGALAPKLAIPCHFGTFAEHGGDPRLFGSLSDAKSPAQRHLVMSPGDGVSLGL